MRNEVRGTAKLIKRLRDLGENGQRMADGIVNVVADEMVLEMKNLAPKDLGGIMQNIGKQQLPESKVKVFSNAPESGYMEFGTGPQVSVPAAFNELAQRVRQRKGGNFEQFVLSLTGWVRRKGIKLQGGKGSNPDMQAAYVIARSILKRGLKPRPFFYPAYVNARRELPKRLKTGLQRLMRNS